MKRVNVRALIHALTALAAIPLLIGCGGGGSASSHSASVNVTIKWPKPTRLIPSKAFYVRVEVFDAPPTGDQRTRRVAVQTATKPQDLTDLNPTTTLSFSALPVGSLTFVTTAYPLSPGDDPNSPPTLPDPAPTSVIPVATSTVSFTTQPGSASLNSFVPISLASTIAKITINSFTVPSVGTNAVDLKASLTVKDIGGDNVAFDQTKLTWDSSDKTVATVDGNGMFAPVTAGRTLITVTDSEAPGIKGDLVVSVGVQPSAGFTINASNVPAASKLLLVRVYDGEINVLYANQDWTTPPSGNIFSKSVEYTGRPLTLKVDALSASGAPIASAVSPLIIGAVNPVSLISNVQSISVTSSAPSVAVGEKVLLTTSATIRNPDLNQDQTIQLPATILDFTVTASDPTGELPPGILPPGLPPHSADPEVDTANKFTGYVLGIKARGSSGPDSNGSVTIKVTYPHLSQFAAITLTVTPKNGSASGTVRSEKR
jgi:hypothetical protein